MGLSLIFDLDEKLPYCFWRSREEEHEDQLKLKAQKHPANDDEAADEVVIKDDEIPVCFSLRH
jgi:hypothetical protein